MTEAETYKTQTRPPPRSNTPSAVEYIVIYPHNHNPATSPLLNTIVAYLDHLTYLVLCPKTTK